jgi:hypothetical protein
VRAQVIAKGSGSPKGLPGMHRHLTKNEDRFFDSHRAAVFALDEFAGDQWARCIT